MTPIILEADSDPRDLTTLAAVRELLQKETSRDFAQDSLLRRMITQASVMLPRELGREFVAIDDATRVFSYHGSGWINVAPYDLRAVTAISYDADGTTPVELTSTGWRLRGQTGDDTYRDVRLVDYVNDRATAADSQTVEITGDWGFAEVPDDVERGVEITVKTWLREGAAFTSDGDLIRFERVGRIPQDVLDGLSHYRLPIIY